MSMREYEVIGKREYRGNAPGEIFHARIPVGAESRALARGDIRVLRTVEPTIQSGSYRLPDGWLQQQGKE